MFKALLTVFLLLLVPYVVVTLSRALKNGRQARRRFYIFLFVIVVLALCLVRIL